MDKRGQFYIIAAAVVVALIMGLTAAVNQATVTPKTLRFFDMSGNFGKESIMVIDYGVYNQNLPPDISEKINDFYANYSSYALATDPNIMMSFIYGNVSSATVGELNVIGSDITSSDTGSRTRTNVIKTPIRYLSQNNQTVSVQLDEDTYNFTLAPEQNFYFVILTKKAGEKLVSIKEK